MVRSKIAAQDDARENRLVDLFNLVRPPDRVRHGTDAQLLVDGHKIEFELKSVTTKGGVSTVRDLGPDHIAKWRDKHWIIAFYIDNDLTTCKYGSPDDMEPWIKQKWDYVKVDFEMAHVIPGALALDVMKRIIGDREFYTREDAKKLHKSQFSAGQYKSYMDLPKGYSPDRMLEIFRERVKYVIERGATLNNPHIPLSYFSSWKEINHDHATKLREYVRDWIASRLPQRLVQVDTP